MCPQTCRNSAYNSLARSILDYGAILWDPYYIKDIDKPERIQRQSARFINEDYKTRNKGCITKMLADLELLSLKERRSTNRLIFFYKVIEGLVPPSPPEDVLKPIRQKRHIRAKKYSDYQSSNFIERQVINDDKCFIVEKAKTEQYKHSFFIRTTVEWNHLDSDTVHAETVEGFKSARHQCY